MAVATPTAAPPRPREAPGADGPTLALTRSATRGDSNAFDRIYREYSGPLYRYCLSLLGQPSDAEDALQATMAAAMGSLPGEGREIALKPWLYRVAHNEAISILRSRGRHGPAPDEEEEATGAACPHQQLEQRERFRTLVDDLSALPDRQRGALLMREMAGLEYGQIAAALGCAEGAARQNVFKARTALQLRQDGRDLGCERIREAISSLDRRRLRGRTFKAHLASCDVCSGFLAAAERRRSDLAALCPPLAPAAASAIYLDLIGTGTSAVSQAGGGALGGLGASGALAGIGGGVAAKGASVAAAVLIAAGVAGALGERTESTASGGAPAEVAREAQRVAAGAALVLEAAGTAPPARSAGARPADDEGVHPASAGVGSDVGSGGERGTAPPVSEVAPAAPVHAPTAELPALPDAPEQVPDASAPEPPRIPDRVDPPPLPQPPATSVSAPSLQLP